MKILDIGCGNNKTPNSIGCDFIKLPDVDIVHDLNQFPYPFKNNEFDIVISRHCLQHLFDISNVIDEIYRILKPHGKLILYLPHYASDNFNTDPTHKSSFGIRSMNYFCDLKGFKYSYYSKNRFKKLKFWISFYQYDKRKSIINLPYYLGFEYLINKFPRFYERFLVYIFPPSELYFELEK